MANKCLLKSFLCHFSCWITRIANPYRGRIAFETFCFSKGNIGGTPRSKEEPPKSRSNRLFYPPPCRVPWHYGVSPSNRGRKTNTIHRKVLSSSPVFCNAKYRGGVTEVTEGLKQYSSVFEWFLYSFLAVSRSITGCFAAQNIGEVSRRDGGVTFYRKSI